jgi:hypothetical protein
MVEFMRGSAKGRTRGTTRETGGRCYRARRCISSSSSVVTSSSRVAASACGYTNGLPRVVAHVEVRLAGSGTGLPGQVLLERTDAFAGLSH